MTRDEAQEFEILKKKISDLTKQNEELDKKLKDAYSINERNASMEAARLRANLQKDFSYLYRDFLEYKDAECNENNYESLYAILRKVFRTLDRNKIKFDED